MLGWVILSVLQLASPVQAQIVSHIIVDDQQGAPGFTLTGDDWTTRGTLGTGYSAEDNSQHYLSSTVGGSDRRGTATWKAQLPCDGRYRIAVWYRMTGNRTRDADHFVHDGDGMAHHRVIDQNGDGASGWQQLGMDDYFCRAGFGGCTVVLDGTDDDASDAANAVRFSLLECDGDPDQWVTACEGEAPAPGTHTATRFAAAVSGGGWERPPLAIGAPDGEGAHSPNLDEGEELLAGGWDFCNPPAEEEITRVELASRGRTQYDSGAYDVLVSLSAAGHLPLSWHHAEWAWDTVDITELNLDWSWFELNQLQARIALHSHPGGRNDSDVWVDAFRVKVTYETVRGANDASIAADATSDAGVGVVDAAPGDVGADVGSVDAARGDAARQDASDGGSDAPPGADSTDGGADAPASERVSTFEGGCAHGGGHRTSAFSVVLLLLWLVPWWLRLVARAGDPRGAVPEQVPPKSRGDLNSARARS